MDLQLLNFRKYLFIISILFLITDQLKAQYPGTNLRGQIQYHPSNRQYFPLPNAIVDLYYYNQATNQYVFITETITNNYGFYFFYTIQPGIYYIQVNKAKNYQILVTTINYYPYQYNYNQFQDIPILYY